MPTGDDEPEADAGDVRASWEPGDADGLSEFVERLRKAIRDDPEQWENVTLDHFLEAFSAVLVSHQPFLLAGHCEGSVPYAVLARLLHLSAIYE